MVRRYDPDRGVDRAVLDRLLDQARRAPSAGNSQGWHFLVLDTPAARDSFWAATTEPDMSGDQWLTGMRTAPVLVVVFSDRAVYEARYARHDKRVGRRGDGHGDLESRWPVPYWHIDAGMAALLMLLGAVDNNLVGCFFGVPVDRVPSVHAAFDVPATLVPVGVVSLGHPPPAAIPTGTGRMGPPGTRGRRPRADVVSYGRFGSA